MQELVPANPDRVSFVVVNVDATNSARVYTREDEPDGGIYVYPRQWIQWEKQDAAHEQWFIKRDTGSSFAHVIEFFKRGDKS